MTEEKQAGLAGTVLSARYRVGQVVGHGGMGSVYRGTDLVLGREVALKIFRADITDPAELDRQQAEARMLAGLNHPGLVTLFDTGTFPAGQREVPFLVMELVNGTDLRHHLDTGPLPGADVARFGAELAESMQYIHHRGVVHRDVKPANILLTRYAADSPLRPKLADFGIARMLDGARLTATNMIPGTAAYLSPEQAMGRHVGPPADIYALGLVLLEALTGKVAFPGPSLEAAAARLSRGPDIPEDVGERWVSLLTAMTERDPEARPDAARVAAELGRAGGWDVPAGQPRAVAATEALPQSTRVLGPGEQSLPPEAPASAPSGARAARIPALSGSQETNATSLHLPPEAPARPPASAGRLPAATRKPATATGKRRWILGAAVVLAVLLAVVLLTSTQRPGPAPVETPGPVITGPLGEHFKELEESVTP